jgi:hypothetical protein
MEREELKQKVVNLWKAGEKCLLNVQHQRRRCLKILDGKIFVLKSVIIIEKAIDDEISF